MMDRSLYPPKPSDLLALCQQNLVYRYDLAEGVRNGLLAPFHYYGVPDDVDYANIPWRSTRFDEEALTAAVATQRRGRERPRAVSNEGGHANARLLRVAATLRLHGVIVFKDRGIRAVAVYSGPTSAPRAVFLGSCAFLARSAGGDGCVCVPGDVERHRRRSLVDGVQRECARREPANGVCVVDCRISAGCRVFLLLFRIHRRKAVAANERAGY
jgi:hypothetical protein